MRTRCSAVVAMAVAGLATALVAAGCGSSSGSAASAASSPVTVHIGFFPNLTHAPALVGISSGIFARDLGSDTLDSSQTFTAGPAENQALLSGSVDIAFEGPSSALSAYSSSHGAIKIVAGVTSGGAGLVVKPSITDPSQLKGKTLATPQLANTQDVALRYWLRSKGLSSTTSGGGDVSVQPSSTGNGTIVTEFKDGSIAGAWVPEPYESQLIAAGGHLLTDESSLWPGGQWATTNLVVRSAFLEQHPATVKRFLKGLVDTLAYMNKNPTAAQAGVQSELASLQGGKKLPTSVLTSAWNRLHFTSDPLASTLLAQVDHGVAVGLLHKPSNLAGIYDLTLLNQVLVSEGKPAVRGL